MRVKRRQIKGLFAWGIFLLFVTQLLGCKMQIVPQEERSEVSFSIISKECIPESLAKLIEERKEEEIKLTYVDQGQRYIVIGYGKQNSGGYSIYIKDLYKTENALYVDTCLMGPKEKEQKQETTSYPMIVLRISEMGLPVVFQ